MSDPHATSQERPVIFESKSIQEFISRMVLWKKYSDPSFSLRRASRNLGCSPSLISQVAQGKRKLTRDRVESFSKLLGLSRQESVFLDRWVFRLRTKYVKERYEPARTGRSSPQNYLLSDWLNVYVKDASALSDFEAEPEKIFRLLGGISSVSHIERSLKFLIREGFIRRMLDGRWTKNEPLVTTSDGILNLKIQKFHKNALKIAERSIELYSPQERVANALIVCLNPESLDELRDLIKEFYEKLIGFTEQHSGENGKLYQVLVNLTPIGGSHEK